jgi:predicted phosphodiesterase
LTVVVVAALLVSCLTCFTQAASESGVLKYGADGLFQILVISDTHQTSADSPTMTAFIGEAIDYAEPDLVVFNGDNLDADAFENDDTMRLAIHRIIDPLLERGIRFALVFGNHDLVFSSEATNTRRQLELFQEIGGELCLTYNEDEELQGAGNCHLPIYSRDGGKIVSNLYFLDSLNDQPEEDQIAWYQKTSNALQAENGGDVVPSLLFLHMTVPEIYNYMIPWPFAHIEGVTYTFEGKEYTMLPDYSHLHGYVLEHPSINTNFGLVDALAARGDVMAAIYGHDHINYYTANVDGVDLVNIPAATILGSYANVYTRGAALFTLRDDNPNAYEKELVQYWRVAMQPGSGITVLSRDWYEWFTGLLYLPQYFINLFFSIFD